jgi:hypothetical protein
MAPYLFDHHSSYTLSLEIETRNNANNYCQPTCQAKKKEERTLLFGGPHRLSLFPLLSFFLPSFFAPLHNPAEIMQSLPSRIVSLFLFLYFLFTLRDFSPLLLRRPSLSLSSLSLLFVLGRVTGRSSVFTPSFRNMVQEFCCPSIFSPISAFGFYFSVFIFNYSFRIVIAPSYPTFHHFPSSPHCSYSHRVFFY